VSDTWRPGLGVAIGTALTGLALGVVMGAVWWWVTPTEQWIRIDGGLGAADLSASSWFAADGWFLILGVIAGLLLTGITWALFRTRPVALVIGIVLGAALLSLVAWSVGGVLGPPDATSVADSLPIGSNVDGSLGLRALGVLGAPAVSALALLALLIAVAPVTEDWQRQVPQQPVGVGTS